MAKCRSSRGFVFFFFALLEVSTPSRRAGVGGRSEFTGGFIVGCAGSRVAERSFILGGPRTTAGFFLRSHEVCEVAG